MMGRARRRLESNYWSTFLAMYSSVHGVERTRNFFLPDDLKDKIEKSAPVAKISLRQLAAAQGHRFEESELHERKEVHHG